MWPAMVASSSGSQAGTAASVRQTAMEGGEIALTPVRGAAGVLRAGGEALA